MQGSAAALQLGSGPQLLLDDYLIESMAHLDRRMQPPRRHGEPVIAEGDLRKLIQPFVTVIHTPDKNLFRMWYSARTAEGRVYHAYAESADGLRWTFPNLGQVELGGSRKNNALATSSIGLDGYPLKVIDNGPGFTPPERRYMMIGYMGIAKKKGAGVAFSADGIEWRAGPRNPIIPFIWNYGDAWDGYCPFNDIIEAFHDPARKRYLAPLGMCALREDGWIGRSRTGPRRRIMGLSESKDFVHWSKPRRILMPPIEKRGNDMTEFYGFTGLYRNGLYIGLLRVLRDDLPADASGPVEGIGWTELVISRDGDNWTRVPGVFLDRDPAPGAWDHAMAWIGDAVIMESEMRFYYGGYNKGHKIGTRQVGLARLPLDRFVSLSPSGAEHGLLRTRLFRTDCARLTLNASAGEGAMAVRVLDRAGKVVPGYAFDDCAALRGDELAQPVRWKGRADLPPAAHADGIALEVKVSGGSLYAIGLSPSPK